MIVARYILSFTVLCFAAYIAAANWGALIVSWVNRRRGIDRYHSPVPVFSVILVWFALLLYPGRPIPVWMLAVPALDVGNWALLVAVLWLPVMLVRERRNKDADGVDSGEGGRVG